MYEMGSSAVGPSHNPIALVRKPKELLAEDWKIELLDAGLH